MSGRTVTVRLENVHVCYSVFADGGGGLKGLTAGQRRRSRRLHAVKGVSFDLHEGETLGIVGPNGSGKSTLLAAMTGLLPLESGDVWVRSRPTLLGVGAVMRPSLSGRRNIIIGGLALGLSLDEIRSQVAEIIAFSGLEEAIDLPMRTYSSGMRARLMFAIATSTIPEILLVDEALSVGDAEFLQRSQQRIQTIREQAGTVVIVSHNHAELRKACDRVIWLDRGLLAGDGEPDEIIDAYETQVLGRIADAPTVRPPEESVATEERGPARRRANRTLTIHIGSNFTVLPIQRYLAADEGRLRSAGFSIPSYLKLRSHYPFVDAADVGDERQTWRDEFVADARERMDDGNDWVLSSERFATQLGRRGIACLRALVDELGFTDARVVLYVQRQDRLAARTHVNDLLAGYAAPFDINEHVEAVARYDWRRLHGWWTLPDAFDVRVRLFPDRPSMPDLVEDFCATAGLPEPAPYQWRPERVLSAEAGEFVLRLVDPTMTEAVARSTVSRAAQVLAHPEAQRFSLTQRESGILMSAFAEQNEWTLEQVAPDGRVADYFSTVPDLPEQRDELTLEQCIDFAAQMARRIGSVVSA